MSTEQLHAAGGAEGRGSLVVIGQGYVGLPLSMRAAEVGFYVRGLDKSTAIVERLNHGRSHVDDITDEQLSEALKHGYEATTDPNVIAEANVVVICVPTPLHPRGGPDLRALESAVDWVSANVTPGTLVVLESTVYPGTTEDVLIPAIEQSGLVVGTDVYVAFSPERIDPGNPTYGLRNTPKVVGAHTEACKQRAIDFYSAIVDHVVGTRGTKEAELAKLLENTFRHINIAMVNEMARFCNELEIDLWDSINAAESKPFGFMAFRPGPGVGGHCIPVDPKYLSHRVRSELGYPFQLLEIAEVINDGAPNYVADRVSALLNAEKKAVNGAKVLLLGVTYKADLSDCRESPADPLCLKLQSQGADVRFHDPYVSQWRPCLHGCASPEVLICEEDLYEAAGEADVVVLLQTHSDYELERLAESATKILDTRGKMNVNAPSVHRL